MALQKTEWAEKYGSLTDTFGVGWMVNYTGRAEFLGGQEGITRLLFRGMVVQCLRGAEAIEGNKAWTTKGRPVIFLAWISMLWRNRGGAVAHDSG